MCLALPTPGDRVGRSSQRIGERKTSRAASATIRLTRHFPPIIEFGFSTAFVSDLVWGSVADLFTA